VATDRQNSRDAKPIEVLGTFDPHDKKNPHAINIDRIKYWVSVGAQPTSSVLHTLKKAGIWSQVKPGAPAKT
jgi:small subunit ribosomal protein S16